MGDGVKSHSEVEEDNIHCSPLIYSASYAIIESYHFERRLKETSVKGF